MTTPLLVPLVMRDVELLFGDAPEAPDFRHHTTQMQWTPSGSPIRVKGLGKRSFLDPGTLDYTLDLAVADSTDPDSLAEYTRQHAGETVTVTTRPTAGAGPSWTAKVLIVPVPIGGTGESELRHNVSLPAEAPPVRSAA